MNCIVGENNSFCLILIEEVSLFAIFAKLENKTAKTGINALKIIFATELLKNNCKGIITDRGKEFSNFKEIEQITNTNVYFCDFGKPRQKPKVERINRDYRHWFPKGLI